MRKIRTYLPFWFMLPASVAITLFFVIPVFMTFVFSFTTMSSDTGILGSRYVVSEATIRTLKASGLDAALVRKLDSRVFDVDEAGLAALRKTNLKPAVVKEIEEKLSGKVYASEKKLFAALKRLSNRPRSFKDRKTVSKSVVQTLKNREFTSPKEFRAGLGSIGVEVADDVFDILLQVMDHAVLTDNQGREADFRHITLIMTSNAGAREAASNAIGFGGGKAGST